LRKVYVALSNMIGWKIEDEEVNLSLLYDLLRRQLCNSDDPWVKETLQWWDRCVPPFLCRPVSHSSVVYLPVKYFQLLPTETTISLISGTWRDRQ